MLSLFRPRVASPFGHTSRLCGTRRGDVFIVGDFLKLYVEERKDRMNRKLELVAIAAFSAGVAFAMPTKQEIADARRLVSELMSPAIANYNEKKMSAGDVAKTSVDFAASAKSEAVRYLFLRGAVGYYVKAGDYGKAADTVELLKAKVNGVPPADIADVISGALGRENARKAPRLQSQLLLAQAQVKASKDVGRLAAQLRKVSTDSVRRQYAEALALSADWKSALAEFAKVSGDVGRMAAADANGSDGSAELGDFWWGYETFYTGAENFFRERAALFYRKAIAEGKVEGLKRTLVEQRLASLVLPDEDASVTPDTKPVPAPVPPRPTPRPKPKDFSGLMARWSFMEGLSPAVGNITPAMPDGAIVENGAISLRSGAPLVFLEGTVPLAPFTVQVWASATDKGLGEANTDTIFKIASSPDSKDDSVFWTWTRYGKKWASSINGFGESKKVGNGKMLLDGQKHLYTVTGEKAGKGLLLKFYQDDTIFGELTTTQPAWKKPPMLILGGFVTPTYDEVRVYSRALAHSDIINSLNLGPDNLPEVGKGK